MVWYVYKCNAKNESHQRHFGDWRGEFFGGPEVGRWGKTSVVEQLDELRPGDMILAYQTDKNELVGVARVVRKKRVPGDVHIILKQVEVFRKGIRVRDMKRVDSRVESIHAFKTRQIKTLYPIEQKDAVYVWNIARAES